jgi:3-oxoacyl-[acyl-carrier-protein] synthase-3
MGSFLPEDVLTNAHLETLVETSDTWILERTGIRTRHRAGVGETTSSMGAIAARKAIEEAGSPAIDAIVVATCTPDTLAPSAACLVQRRLGLAGQPAFDINAACSGFVYGMGLANGMISSGMAGTVLLVTAESMTSLVDYGDRTTCVLFGDGAAAVILGARDGGAIRAHRWGADGGEAEMIFYGPSEADPDGEDHLRMAGRGTFRRAVDQLCAMATAMCEDAGWRVDEVEHFVPHQANQRIIEAAAKRLHVPLERFVLAVAEMGNTSAASIPLAIDAARGERRFHAGDRVVCMAFGAGVTWGGVAFEWTLGLP